MVIGSGSRRLCAKRRYDIRRAAVDDDSIGEEEEEEDTVDFFRLK